MAGGSYRIRSPQLDQPTLLETDPACKNCHLEIELPNRIAEPLPIPERFVSFDLQNQSPREIIVRLERFAQRKLALTAAEACAHPLFRKLFPDEVLSANDLVSVQDRILVACRIVEFEKIVEERGEVAVNAILPVLIHETVDVSGGVQRVSQGHDRVILGVEQAAQVVAVCETILRIMKSTGLDFAILIDSGKLQSKESLAGREYFGRSIRATEALLVEARAGQVVVRKSVCREGDFQTWADQHLESVATDSPPLAGSNGFSVFTVKTPESE